MKCAIAGNQCVIKTCFSCMHVAFVMAGFVSFFGCHFWSWKVHLLCCYQPFKNPRYFGTSCGDAAMLSFWTCNQRFSAYRGAATINPLATWCDRKIIQKKYQKGITVTWITRCWFLLDLPRTRVPSLPLETLPERPSHPTGRSLLHQHVHADALSTSPPPQGPPYWLKLAIPSDPYYSSLIRMYLQLKCVYVHLY
jgi:hypothetical protein